MEFVELLNVEAMSASLWALVALVGGLLAALPLLLGMGDYIADPKILPLDRVEEKQMPASPPLPLPDGSILLSDGSKVQAELLEAPPIPERWATAQPEEDTQDEPTELIQFFCLDIRAELQEVDDLLQQAGLVETGLPNGVLRDARTGRFVSRRALAL